VLLLLLLDEGNSEEGDAILEPTMDEDDRRFISYFAVWLDDVMAECDCSCP
jgi:hypothetical protein